MGGHVFPILTLPPHPTPQGLPSAPALSALSQASNLDWWSVSHMVIYMFQCYSPKSSHPRLFPQSPKVCSLHLCLLYERKVLYMCFYIFLKWSKICIQRNAHVWRVQLHKFWQRMCVINIAHWHMLWHMHIDIKTQHIKKNFFWPYHTAGGILVLWLGTEPASPCTGRPNLNPWTMGDVQDVAYFPLSKKFLCVRCWSVTTGNHDSDFSPMFCLF